MASIHTKTITTGFLAFGKKKILHTSPQRVTVKSIVADSHSFAIFLGRRSRSIHLRLPLSSRFSLFDLTPPLLRARFRALRSPRSTMSNLQAGAGSSQPSSDKTVRVVIKGRVQGVFYRDWTVENATQLGLNGWVRNRRDGSVEALFSGTPEAVQEMEHRCRRGPPHAIVTGLEIFPSDDNPGVGFERRATA